MQFVVIGRDGKDKDALARRMAARPRHAELGDEMERKGTLLYRLATLDEAGNMDGSVLVVDLPSRSELDAWLKDEPYVVGKVWKQVEVHACKVIPRLPKN
jgi:hypothetical protein